MSAQSCRWWSRPASAIEASPCIETHTSRRAYMLSYLQSNSFPHVKAPGEGSCRPVPCPLLRSHLNPDPLGVALTDEPATRLARAERLVSSANVLAIMLWRRQRARIVQDHSRPKNVPFSRFLLGADISILTARGSLRRPNIVRPADDTRDTYERKML